MNEEQFREIIEASRVGSPPDTGMKFSDWQAENENEANLSYRFPSIWAALDDIAGEEDENKEE